MPLLDTMSAWLEELAFDVRSAMRALVRDGSFSLTAVVTLALAIGLNVTAFVVMNAMLVRGFPLVEQDVHEDWLKTTFGDRLKCGRVEYAPPAGVGHAWRK